MQRAQLVAVRVAQVSEIEFRRAAFAHARRIFDRGAAGRDARLVPRIRLRRIFRGETDGAAIGVARGLAVDGLGHAEHALRRHIKETSFRIDHAGPDAQRAERGVVEFLGPLNVIRYDKDMREHAFPLLMLWPWILAGGILRTAGLRSNGA